MASSLGSNIRTARRAAGHTQKSLAAELGVESITVSRWERGVTSPSLPRLRQVAALTEARMADLVGTDAGDQWADEIAAIREELKMVHDLMERIVRVLELAKVRS